MYRAIVARKVRKTFDELSERKPEAMTSQLDGTFEYHFRGSSALGGSRTTTAVMHEWFERVYRLFPGLVFDVQDVTVGGPPWNTVAMTHVGIGADGYENELFQKIHLRWGKITKIITLENLEVLNQHLATSAEAGHPDALAVQLIDS